MSRASGIARNATHIYGISLGKRTASHRSFNPLKGLPDFGSLHNGTRLRVGDFMDEAMPPISIAALAGRTSTLIPDEAIKPLIKRMASLYPPHGECITIKRSLNGQVTPDLKERLGSVIIRIEAVDCSVLEGRDDVAEHLVTIRDELEMMSENHRYIEDTRASISEVAKGSINYGIAINCQATLDNLKSDLSRWETENREWEQDIAVHTERLEEIFPAIVEQKEVRPPVLERRFDPETLGDRAWAFYTRHYLNTPDGMRQFRYRLQLVMDHLADHRIDAHQLVQRLKGLDPYEKTPHPKHEIFVGSLGMVDAIYTSVREGYEVVGLEAPVKKKNGNEWYDITDVDLILRRQNEAGYTLMEVKNSSSGSIGVILEQVFGLAKPVGSLMEVIKDPIDGNYIFHRSLRATRRLVWKVSNPGLYEVAGLLKKDEPVTLRQFLTRLRNFKGEIFLAKHGMHMSQAAINSFAQKWLDKLNGRDDLLDIEFELRGF